MATCSWIGSAEAVAQVDRFTVGGTVEAADIFAVTMGQKTVEVAAGSTVVATVAATIVAALAALDSSLYPEFAKVTATDNEDGTFDLTANTPGVPFVATPSTSETGGGAADDQTFTKAALVANSGPNCVDVADNWSGGAVPGAGDVAIAEYSDVSMLFGLDGLSGTGASWDFRQSFTGDVGLPAWNPAGYHEYLPTYLELDSTLVSIGAGEGRGSGRIKINSGSVQTAVTIHNTGSPVESGVRSVCWKGTHASNTVTVQNGSVAIAPFAEEVATIATLTLGWTSNQNSDVQADLSSGCTLGAVVKSGGNLTVDCATTSILQTGGSTKILSGAHASIVADEGVVDYRSSGTVTAAEIGDGATLSFQKSMVSRTVSAAVIHSGGHIQDPFKTVTWTTGIDLYRCGLSDVKIDLGQHWTLTPSAV